MGEDVFLVAKVQFFQAMEKQRNISILTMCKIST